MDHLPMLVHSSEIAGAPAGQITAKTSRKPRRVVALGAAVVLSAAALVVAAPAASAATTQTATCVDGGGVRWNASAVWGEVYNSTGGSAAITMDYAGWTTTKSGTIKTDSVVKTYNGSGSLLQTLNWTGSFDYGSGTAFKSRNPLNPPSAPGKSKVAVTLGVDGDGFGNCTVTFTQPIATPTTSDRYEADVITATNAERTSRSLVAVAAQACVDKHAELQSAKMAAEKRMYHQDLQPVLTDCNLRAVGENVAYGYTDGTKVTAAWMASTGHRGNILNAGYRLIGVGATQDSDGRWYTAQVFGATG
jgi:uncharacterized protein YkwD